MKKIDPALLEKAVQRLVVALHPMRIYLYGSHVYGEPHEDSDVDLLIVVAESNLSARRQTVEAHRALRGLFIPAEIKVVTQEKFKKRAKWFSSVERVVAEKGRVLYESCC